MVKLPCQEPKRRLGDSVLIREPESYPPVTQASHITQTWIVQQIADEGVAYGEIASRQASYWENGVFKLIDLPIDA
jgi:hypothetical protein